MEVHPNINDPVVLRDHADREYASRVEDLGDGLLVVARPHDLPADEAFETGAVVSVVWADSGGGVTVLPTQILAVHTEGTLRLWSLVVTGPAVTEQRRRFVRLPAAGPVTLRSADENETDAVTGSLVDVSEASVRCAVAAGAADGFLASRREVITEFRLGAADFSVPGRVEFLRPTKHPSEFEEVVVVFDEPVAAGDALRKQVFAQQLRTLRARSQSSHQTGGPAQR